MLDETGMSGKVILISMLEDEDPSLFKQILRKHEVGNLGQAFQGVWRVGEYEIELLSACLQESEHITAKCYAVVFAKLFQALAYESVVVTVKFHANHLTAPSREQFQRNAPSTREKIECRGTLEVYLPR